MESINLFFAVDDNYCPFLSATLVSILKNSNKNYNYNLYVLHSGVGEKNQKILREQVGNSANLLFIDMKEKLEYLSSKLVTRDYYTKTTYYRLFIPTMFPELKKALYLDSDIIVNGDITNLYNVELDNNLVGAIPDSVIQNFEVFRNYSEQVLGIKHEKYFNAGILLMNLEEMRKFNFEDKFISALEKYKFRVAQDQDYLNVITKDRVKYIDFSWNVMPIVNNICKPEIRNLIHYNMLWKPWIFDDVLYSDEFWKYAKSCPMYDDILNIKKSYSEETKKELLKGEDKLRELAASEINNPKNYNRLYNSNN